MSRPTHGQQTACPPTGGHCAHGGHGGRIAVRPVREADRAAAVGLHGRCSARTLLARYRGPADGADGYLGHLLSPRFGHTLGAWTAGGRLVGMGHLLWDGDEAEVAVLVEDAWQLRGIGTALLERLTALAAHAGYPDVYAVTGTADRGMAAALRGLGLPLDRRVEDEATAVLTLTLGRATVRAPAPDDAGVLFEAGSPEH
ncbi:GNAT family N-acetyltransferase [Streptomyces sp. NRRL F-5126]|uniref:GNAT family N-acetyltransferase n=1 Tax=Streptomyces sp. NRRL F-5126 TaxID=1463857 RepID=UPI0004CC6204